MHEEIIEIYVTDMFNDLVGGVFSLVCIYSYID